MHVQPFFSLNKKAFYYHFFDIFKLRGTMNNWLNLWCSVKMSFRSPQLCCFYRMSLWDGAGFGLMTRFSEILISGNQLWLHQKLLGFDHHLHVCDHNAHPHWWQEGIGGHVQLCPRDDQRQQVRKHEGLYLLSAALKLPLTLHLSIFIDNDSIKSFQIHQSDYFSWLPLMWIFIVTDNNLSWVPNGILVFSLSWLTLHDLFIHSKKCRVLI